MSLLSQNIRHQRKSCDMTQQDLADAIGIKRSLVGAYEEGRAEPPLATLVRMSEIFSVTVDQLITVDLSTGKSTRKSSKEDAQLKVLSVTVDNEGDENIVLVPQKAAAGYMNGYSDPEYIKDLPSFHLPSLPKNATYRAFEITGDSMLPILPGSIVIGEYVENISDIRDGNAYILVTQKEGVVYKRVFNYTEEKGKLYLVSDNEVYAPYEVDVEEVHEIWSAKAFISSNLPDPREEEERMTLDKLAKIVLDLQQEVIRLKEG